MVRELLFREEALLSVLTERRAFRPYGLHGGQQQPSPFLSGFLNSSCQSALRPRQTASTLSSGCPLTTSPRLSGHSAP